MRSARVAVAFVLVLHHGTAGHWVLQARPRRLRRRTEQIVGLAVLLLPLLLWAYRQVLQDKRSLAMRAEDEPSAAAAPSIPTTR